MYFSLYEDTGFPFRSNYYIKLEVIFTGYTIKRWKRSHWMCSVIKVKDFPKAIGELKQSSVDQIGYLFVSEFKIRDLTWETIKMFPSIKRKRQTRSK